MGVKIGPKRTILEHCKAKAGRREAQRKRPLDVTLFVVSARIARARKRTGIRAAVYAKAQEKLGYYMPGHEDATIRYGEGEDADTLLIRVAFMTPENAVVSRTVDEMVAPANALRRIVLQDYDATDTMLHYQSIENPVEFEVVFRNDAVEAEMKQRFKEGTTEVGHPCWRSFVFVKDTEVFMGAIQWKCNQTEQKWAEFDES
eukprot:m51a1_g5602 hypothetical protein (202) ;mRNA; r:697515-698577